MRSGSWNWAGFAMLRIGPTPVRSSPICQLYAAPSLVPDGV
jgi:hypothetical protein